MGTWQLNGDVICMWRQDVLSAAVSTSRSGMPACNRIWETRSCDDGSRMIGREGWIVREERGLEANFVTGLHSNELRQPPNQGLAESGAADAREDNVTGSNTQLARLIGWLAALSADARRKIMAMVADATENSTTCRPD